MKCTHFGGREEEVGAFSATCGRGFTRIELNYEDYTRLKEAPAAALEYLCVLTTRLLPGGELVFYKAPAVTS